MMDERQFWDIIDTSRRRACQVKRGEVEDFIDVHEKTLADELRKLPAGQVAAFDYRFGDYERLAYRWDLWDAVYWLHGGCSDDGFMDFRACLISLGKDWFFRVLDDPDFLADLVDRPDVPYLLAQGFGYVAARVYKEKTGQGVPDPPGGYPPHLGEPAGEQVDHEDEEAMRKRYPKIVAKFPDMGD